MSTSHTHFYPSPLFLSVDEFLAEQGISKLDILTTPTNSYIHTLIHTYISLIYLMSTFPRFLSVDEFLAEQGISKLDILKIDAEGNDMQVIRGAGKALNTTVGVFTFEGT